MRRESVPLFTVYSLVFLGLVFWWTHPPGAHHASGNEDRVVQRPDRPDGSDVASERSTPPAERAPSLTAEPKLAIQDREISRARHHPDDILAALTVFLEAEGETFEGKLAVAAVIRNRMRERYQSDGTVHGTVLRSWQFEPWLYRDPASVDFDLDNPSMRDSLLAWLLVQDGREVVDGAVLFYNPRLVQTPAWARISRNVASIGRHEFFKPPKAAI